MRGQRNSHPHKHKAMNLNHYSSVLCRSCACPIQSTMWRAG